MLDTHTMTLVLDVMLGLGLVAHAVDGFRRGFVRTVGGAIGLVTGGLVALRYGPGLLEHLAPNLHPVLLLVCLVGLVVFAAGVGQTLIGVLTRRLLPVQKSATGRIDGVLGGLLTLALTVSVVWLGAGMLRAAVPAPVVDVLDASRVLRGIDAVAPVSRDQTLDRVGSLFAQYDFPRVFDEITQENRPVDPPDPALAADAEITRAGASVVQIDATAPRCRRLQEGSGFVVAPGLVVTNAHVITGASRVDIRKDRLRSRAEVVAFDPDRDLAVLATDTGDLAPIPTARHTLERGAEGAVAGYPLAGPYRAEPARVREAVVARGRDIYDRSTIERDIYAVRADVEPGNSGGPLLTADGEVAGVVFARSFDDPGTGYVLRLSELEPVLDGVDVTRPVPVGPCTQD